MSDNNETDVMNAIGLDSVVPADGISDNACDTADTDKTRNMRSAAYRTWYEKNKDRLSKQRASRYQNDPEYRDSIKASRRRQREKERVRKQMSGAPTGNVLKNRKPRQFKVVHPELGAYVSEFVSIGHLALEIGVEPSTVRRWELTDVIPRAEFRSDGGHRLYSADQIDAIKEAYTSTIAIQRESGTMPDLSLFREEAHRLCGRLVMGCKPSRFVKAEPSV